MVVVRSNANRLNPPQGSEKYRLLLPNVQLAYTGMISMYILQTYMCNNCSLTLHFGATAMHDGLNTDEVERTKNKNNNSVAGCIDKSMGYITK